jgi:hypothetical protein
MLRRRHCCSQLEVYVRIVRARVKLDGPEHDSRAEPSSAMERYQVRLPLLQFGLEKQWQRITFGRSRLRKVQDRMEEEQVHDHESRS